MFTPGIGVIHKTPIYNVKGTVHPKMYLPVTFLPSFKSFVWRTNIGTFLINDN